MIPIDFEQITRVEQEEDGEPALSVTLSTKRPKTYYNWVAVGE